MILPMRPLALLALFVLCSCAGGKHLHPGPGASVDARYIAADISQYKALAILDFSESAPAQGLEPDVCALAGLRLNSGQAEAGSGAAAAEQFHIALAQAGYSVIDRDKTKAAAAEAGVEMRLANGAAMAAFSADKLGADAVMMGCVARYEERVGSWFIADKPAHVAFGAVIFDPKRGEPVWAGKFDKRQMSLFADLTQWRLFSRGGLAWLTAEELSLVGVEFLAESFPPARPGD